jgi:lauroyl/myristoyl acyltransferase
MSTESGKRLHQAKLQPYRPVERCIREMYAWLMVKALSWIRAAPPERRLARARTAARLLARPDVALFLRNAPLVHGSELTRRLHGARFEYWARWMRDASQLVGAGPAGLLARVEVSGIQHLIAAQAENKGVLLVSAHTGSWWDAPSVAAALGLPVSAVLAPFMQSEMVRYLKQVSAELNCSLTFVRLGAYEAARTAFRKGEIFYLACDYATRSDRSIGLPIGERAEIRLDTGPGLMAVRHQVPVVWVDTYHDENGRSCVHFLPAIHAGKGTDHPVAESVLHYFLKRLNDLNAGHPEQWWLLGFHPLHPRPQPLHPPTSDPT